MKTKSIFCLSALLFILSVPLSAQTRVKVSILGDSYSTFYGYVTPASNLCWYGVPGEKKENDVLRVEDTWWHRLAAAQGWEIERNNSYSGSTVCNTGYDKADYSDRSFVTRMDSLGSPDIILIFGGTNDSWAGVPIGRYQYAHWAKANLYSFRPAFCHLLDYVTRYYPNARVFNITNTELSPEITESMAEICRYFRVVNIRLKDIDKQWGHPSVKGMESIAYQVGKAVRRMERSLEKVSRKR